MTQFHDELQRDLHSLQQSFSDLESLKQSFTELDVQLVEQAREMRENGIPPKAELATGIETLRQNFDELRLRTSDLAHSLASAPATEQLSSLKEIERLAWEISQHLTKQQSRQRAEHALRRVIDLRHSRRADHQPLQACRTYAQQMLDILDASEAVLPDEAQNLAKGEHAFAYLLQIVDCRDELDEDQLAQWQDAVTNHLDGFGQWLWNSALLGRLISPEEAPKPPTPPSSTETNFMPEQTASEPQLAEPEVSPPEPAIEPATVFDEATPREPEPPAAPIVQPAESEIIPIAPPEKPGEQPEEVTSGLGKQVGAETTVSAPEITSPKLFPFPPPEAKPKTAGTGLSEKLAEQARDSIWQLIADNRLGVAYHLSRAIETGAPYLQPQLPSWLLRALALSGHVRHDVGHLAQLLLNDFSQFTEKVFAEDDEEWNHAVRFLLIAETLRPTLLAPSTGALNILRQIYPAGGLEKLFSYCEAIADFGRFRRPLNLLALRQFHSDDEWRQVVERLQANAGRWRKAAPGFDMNFGQASDVWKHWLMADGEKLHTLLDAIKGDDARRLDECREIVKFFSDDENIIILADQTNRTTHRGRAANIRDKAQDLLRKHTREAIEWGCQWIELQEGRPSRGLDNLQRKALDLQDKLNGLRPAVASQLAEFERRWSSSSLVGSGVAACRRAIEDIQAIFDQSREQAMSEPAAADLLHADLLRIPTLLMGEDWEPEVEDHERFVGDLRALTACDCGWLAAFEWQKGERDHEATLRIIEYLERRPDEFDGDLNRLRSTREKHLRECAAALQEDLEATRQVIEDAVWHGLLREQERVSYVTQVEEIEQSLSRTLRFGQRQKQLAAIRSAIDDQRRAECEKLRQWLAEELANPQSPVRENGRAAAIEEALDRGDVWSADEYLSGQSPAQLAPMSGDLEEFFPDLLNRIAVFLRPAAGQPPWLTLAGQARDYAAEPQCGGALGPVSLPESEDGNQPQLIAQLLETWRLAKDQHRLDHSAAGDILSKIGFEVTQCSPMPEHRGVWHSVRAKQLSDRDEGCPVPGYGSEAKGQYRLLCVWLTPHVDDLLKAVKEIALNSHVIVFYFGSLTETNRRLLARRCLESKRTLLVMDDALLLFLCAKSTLTARRRAFFNCTLPFTFLNPYDSENSDVPPEMFHGREEEKRRILDLNGGCFIYGGRRLGKTALLLTAQREFHNPAQGRIALWLDLKSLLAKNGTRLSSLWGELAYQLKDSAKLAGQDFSEFSGLSRQSTANTLIEAIKSWLNVNPERRLLLLLDEADRFLDLDSRVENGEAYTYVTRLKDLMTGTERRVKVVFAGLHNVQRTTHLPNHPLTRLGQPVCAGPLLESGAGRSEVQAAINLIQLPLAALGYRFEQPQLVRRILWQTNYYPNLIQLYCYRLLELLTNRDHLSPAESDIPPRLITARHLQEVYQSAQLRNDIRLRFRDTLDLDKRYLLIANAIAYDDPRRSHVGLTVEEIRRLATDWWVEGFKKSAEGENFRVLLDEMVGLGVLHKTGAEHYTLRSHNVALLIGTESEIAETLLSSVSWQAEEPYGAAIFREAYGDSPARRSPLTAEQESVLREERNSVAVLAGNAAGGLHELPSYLKWSFGEDFFIGLEAANNLHEFEQELEKLNGREMDGVTLVLVSQNCPWNEHWIEAAKRKLKKLRAPHAFVQIAFVADPLALWQLLDGGQLADAGGGSHFPLLKLAPWHDLSLRHWLSDCNLPGDESDCRRIIAGTGKWPSLLMRLYDGWRAAARTQNNLTIELQKIRQEAALSESELGLTIGQPVRVLDLLSQWGETTQAADFAVIAEDLSVDLIRRSLLWADWLSLASPAGNDCWRLDPFVNAVLSARRER